MPSTKPDSQISPARSAENQTPQKGRRSIFALICLYIAWLLLLFATVAFSSRFDALAAFTVLPVWSCWLVGSIVTLLALSLRRTWSFKILASSWLLFLLWFADEPWSLARGLLPVAELPKGQRLRVISLNCNSGDPQIAAEVAAYKPDIVLLQESPSKTDVQLLAHQLFGENAGVVWGVDGTIIARGSIKPSALTPQQSVYFVQGRVQLIDGPQVEVVSLRLVTPPFRLDLWSPQNWKAYGENRQLQRSQIEVVKQQLEKVPASNPVVIGGDFNAPQGDAIFRSLKDVGLYDSFSKAGRGWGNTITNEFPVLRIDQIWASEHLEAHKSIAEPSLTSDHRVVIVDFKVP